MVIIEIKWNNYYLLAFLPELIGCKSSIDSFVSISIEFFANNQGILRRKKLETPNFL